ncbi:hypothetical protein GUITHDRAFT_57440, partial [Guillardia theta CCMP2712]
ARVHKKANDGSTPLHWAAWATRIKVVHYLLRHGANPNIQDADGNSALHLATDMGDSDTVEQLLDHRADAGIPNRFRCTAAHYAMQHGS